ncbi:carbon monoxide dehydrogenase [Saccharopolyspora subtropica]|uniref:Carbon monoxide dehydrogenase n=1 Tax=Saccharopolyspora thermophila TaxID=89367 RepID=A0A917JXF5_9PSEU|nr:xanthine dehydrogenase family protein subunit M [Saccharopolyspora subtropica]GGI88689.1 carbon monoxide dehydrogenase [Saccharopolyspora subtropica]
MKPASFDYHRAHDVRGATELLAELGDEAKLLAGGQSLVAMMNFRLARPAALVDIGRISGLSYQRRDGAALRIGALTTHRAIETADAPEIIGPFGVLSRAAGWIGHYPIRTRGTIGGSLAHADSTAEWCLLAVLLDARIVVASTRGRRTVAAADFFHGFLTTALEPDEMIVEVVFPNPAPHAALTEFAQRKGDFAIVAAAVSLDVADGVCRGGRVALGGVDSVPVRVAEAEAVLAGGELGAELFTACANAAAAAIEPGSDAHGSAEYRRRLARTLVVRACQEAMAG